MNQGDVFERPHPIPTDHQTKSLANMTKVELVLACRGRELERIGKKNGVAGISQAPSKLRRCKALIVLAGKKEEEKA